MSKELIEVVVTINSGVLEVEQLPPGVRLTVKDYDFDSDFEEDVDSNILADKDGTQYREDIHVG